MCKKLIAFLLLATALNVNAQENSIEQSASVEKSVFSIQTGLVGVWANNELRLSNQFALRSEIGLELGIITNADTDESKAALAPVISLEPKWYYNLEKRNRKGKNIKGNSGNAFSIKANYNPDWFLISSENDVDMISQLAIIPKWSMRRVYGKHFTFETGFGLGPIIYLEKFPPYSSGGNDVYADIHVRIGYSF